MTECRYCKAEIEFKQILSTGKWSAVNLGGTEHKCKGKTETEFVQSQRFDPIGEDV